MAESTAAAPLEGPASEREGKYLTFALGETEYGLGILKVLEIIRMIEITKVPRTPEFARGVMNLRGQIIPVLELRRIFDMESIEDTDETRTIVVEMESVKVGIVVDQVMEVLDVQEDEIEDAPPFGVSVNTEFVLGMGNRGERVTILLEIDKVMSSEAVSAPASLEMH